MSTHLKLVEEPVERPSGVWDYISPSRLNLWLACALKFRLRYIDGVKSPTTPAMFLGRMTHSALECWYRHRLLGVRLPVMDVLRRAQESWGSAAAEEQVAFESTAAEDECRGQMVGLVSTYLAQVPDDEARPLAVEAALEAPLVDPATGENLGLPLVGVIDLALDEPDGPLIADFKTVSRGGEPLEVMHEVQLTSYSYLFRHASHGREASLEIRNLVKTKVPRVEYHRYAARDDRHFRRLFAVIRGYLDDLDRGRFVFRPGLGCSSCDFRHTHCRAWAG